MKINILKSIIITCCIFVIGIGSAVAIKKINSTYAVSYDYYAKFCANGGTWSTGDKNDVCRTIQYSGKYYFTEDKIKISRKGCTFAGWRLESTGKVLTQYIDAAENTGKLNAVWENCTEPEKFNVSFNLNGGSGSIPSQTVEAGKTASKPANPSRTGYTFKHWSLTSSGTAYNFSSQVKNNIVLYAIWNINTYTVKFNLNGGNGTANAQTINYGQKVTKPSNPTRNEHKFLYWSTTCDGSAYDFNRGVDSSFTLCAVWQKNIETPVTPTPQPPPSNPVPSIPSYTITFDLNGGSGNIPSQKVQKGNKITKPGDPTKENASFVGWSTSKSCDSTYDFNKTVTSDITLYACFKNEYTVTFSMQGLPFISKYTEKFKEKSNLNTYNRSYELIVFDKNTYKMNNITNCASMLQKKYSRLSLEEAKTECNGIINKFNCENNNNCYGNKYITLEQKDSKDIIYLKDNGVISVDYQTYNYLGLYKDRTCKTEYKYSTSITKNIELYECYKLSTGKVSKPDEDPKEKPNNENKGLSFGTIFTIVVLSLLIVFIVFIILKSKKANSVK